MSADSQKESDLFSSVAKKDASSPYDLDGDGKVSTTEYTLCRLCLTAAVLIALGSQGIEYL